MKTPVSRTRITLFAMVSVAIAAHGAAAQASGTASAGSPAYTAADVAFMDGMIEHHAQALVMCAMAPTHGAGEKVALFCKKVMISQRDDITLMQNWLRDRGEKVPDPDAPPAHAMMSMGEDSMLMPGMLTAAQMKQLEAAHGTTWDSLFLVGMIQHHGGALTMVKNLFDTAGAGQQAEIFAFATGIDADQRAEIVRMRQLLATYTKKSPN